jgi:hypothetical protein
MARSRGKTTGRQECDNFFALPRRIIRGREYARLSAHAVKLLIDLGAQYYGSNNGNLCASWTLMRERGWRSKATLHRAIMELRKGNWIVVTRQGGRNKPNLYALTFRRINECGGKLDINETFATSNAWQDNNLSTPYVNQISTLAVPT